MFLLVIDRKFIFKTNLFIIYFVFDSSLLSFNMMVYTRLVLTQFLQTHLPGH